MLKHVIIHIPHASITIPAEYRSDYNQHALSHELLVMTDWYCHELFACEAEMTNMPVSRLVCDVERFRDDTDEIMNKQGMGLYYTHSSENKVFRKFSPEKRQEIVQKYYDPHHARLTAAAEKRLQQTGSCLIIDSHYFYPRPLPYEPDQTADRPDICLGTDNYHTPPAFIEKLTTFLRDNGLTVKINSPFAGALVPIKYYQQEKAVQSITIEINRRLYLTKNGEKNTGFSHVKKLMTTLIHLAAEK